MNSVNHEAPVKIAAKARHGAAIHAGALGLSLAAFTVMLPIAASARTEAQVATKRVAPVAIVTTRDFRIAVVAQQRDGGVTPTAEVRVGVAQRVGRSWRERGERRLSETYFWRTVTGPRAICRLEVASANARTGRRPLITIQLLRSPSLGCGPRHRIRLLGR